MNMKKFVLLLVIIFIFVRIAKDTEKETSLPIQLEQSEVAFSPLPLEDGEAYQPPSDNPPGDVENLIQINPLEVSYITTRH